MDVFINYNLKVLRGSKGKRYFLPQNERMQNVNSSGLPYKRGGWHTSARRLNESAKRHSPRCPTPQGTLGTVGRLPPAGSRIQGLHNWWRSFSIPLSEGTYKDEYHLNHITRDIIIIIILIRPSTERQLPNVRLFQVRSLSFI